MKKLYKFESDKVSYWEAWEANGAITIHWGELGDRGETEILRLERGQSAKQLIEQEAKKYRAEDYRQLKEGEEVTLLVQYELEGWGTAEDLHKRHAVENLLNEGLGWTGNGKCDGGDIGSGTMNVCSLVVNPYIASNTVIQELRKNNLLEAAVIAIERDDSFEVLYPENFEKEFAYWY